MLAIALKGPTGLSIDASLGSFSFYCFGVYDDPKCKLTYKRNKEPSDALHEISLIQYRELFWFSILVADDYFTVPEGSFLLTAFFCLRRGFSISLGWILRKHYKL